MAKNTNQGFRQGQVKSRSQVQNTKTGQFVKRDAKTGKFLSAKDSPYKGVKLEKSKEGCV